ncbi:MAG: UDP-N-acetylmuramoyl-L-alanine--D-glutamate ligase [Planctomycetota bacterium]
MRRMQLKGKRVTVMGLGRFGGGSGVAKFLLGQGAAVTVTDLDAPENLAEPVAALGDGVTYHLGGHRPEDFTGAGLVVVNPAVKPGNEFVELARQSGVPVTTEINLFFERCPARIIGVTGSVGKTTTVSMIGHALAGPRVWVGGNIGRSLLGELDEMSGEDVVVLELSSAQLHRLVPTGRAPDISVVTNISPNHIDWHGSMGRYVAAKKHIVTAQSPDGVAALNYDDEVLRGWAGDCAAPVLLFSTLEELPDGVFVRGGKIVARLQGNETVVLDVAGLKVPGAHNVSNAAAAVAACAAAGADLRAAGERLAEFEGAEHRLEFVREAGGVRYFNDSKATTPASSVAALRSFDEPTVLILGGRDKGAEYDGIAAEAARCRAVVLVGEMADRLAALLDAKAPGLTKVRATSFENAVTSAAGLARPGDVVLLSPACTSYDMFKNFEERGREFKDIVRRLSG